MAFSNFSNLAIKEPTPAPTGLESFIPRWREHQLHKEQTDSLIKDLMLYCEHLETNYHQQVEHSQKLSSQLRGAQYQLETSNKARRDLQQRIAACGLDATDASNQYILVLIDGDGLIFKDELIKQGLEGGKKAAHALQKEVSEKCENPERTEVIAKVFANLSGLNKALKRNGSLESEADVRDFMLGFTQGETSFDFVDIGYGRARARDKLQETARWHVRNAGCLQVLLGVSHDAEYAPFVDQMVSDESTSDRVTVVGGCPMAGDIASTGVKNLIIDAVFSSEKLANRSPPPAYSASVRSSTPVSQASGPLTMSYAIATQRASPPPQLVLPLAKKSPATAVAKSIGKPVALSQPDWNPGARGLDPPIPINQAVLDQVKRRKDSDKLCNNHYLRGPCAKGDTCCFEHHYKPNADELKAISFLARLNPCTNGQDCDVDNCIYGHHCPSVINGLCVHPYCKFRAEEHPPGTKLMAKKKKESDY